MKNIDVSIVLVEPQSPGNIGMVCRAMKNMGIYNLKIVKGCDRFQPESLKFAVSAKDILEKAVVYDTLQAAVAQCSIVVGTTRRHGKYRNEVLAPDEAAKKIATKAAAGLKAAVVFGREDSGLTTEELSLCSHFSTIPTSTEYASINLSQAVLILCYEIMKAVPNSKIEVDNREIATSEDMESLFEQMKATLTHIGFLNSQNPEHIMRSMRRIFFRNALDSREASILRGMFSQIEWATANFDGRKKI